MSLRYYTDFEFCHGWRGVETISIGIVSQDGREYYAINSQMNLSEAGTWLIENVVTRLERNPKLWKKEQTIKEEVQDFLGFGPNEGWIPDHHHTKVGRPEIWGWYPAYDWYLLSRMFGPFDEHPKSFPNEMFCLHQWLEAVEFEKNYGRTRLSKPQNAHNALADAKWVKEYHELLLDKRSKAERSFAECLR